MAELAKAAAAGLKHIGFIMDGNGRWAQSRGLPRNAGHSAGAKALEKTVAYCCDIGVECVTVYAFSTENWSRSEEEVSGLMNLLDRYLSEILERAKSDGNTQYQNVQILFIGDISVLPDPLRVKIAEVEAETQRRSPNPKMRFNIALNYGGRSEIVAAVAKFMAKYHGRIPTEQDISANLYTAGCPELDLVIRTAGEMRLSNFLLWQASYAEFWSTPVLWPDFSPKELDRAIDDFAKRTRKFGAVAETEKTKT